MTNRPPGRSTRRTSARAVASGSQCSMTSKADTASKVASSNGSASAEPHTPSDPSPRGSMSSETVRWADSRNHAALGPSALPRSSASSAPSTCGRSAASSRSARATYHQ